MRRRGRAAAIVLGTLIVPPAVMWVLFTGIGWADPKGWAAWRVGMVAAGATGVITLIASIVTFTYYADKGYW